MPWPQVLKSDAIVAHGVGGNTQQIKNVIDILHFANGKEHQQIVNADDEDHSVKRTKQKILVQCVRNEPVCRSQGDSYVSKFVRLDLEIINLHVVRARVEHNF